MLRAWTLMGLFLLPTAGAVLAPFDATAPADPSADLLASARLAPAGALAFAQVDFVVGDTRLLDTRWGELTVDAAAMVAAAPFPDGYLNVVTPQGWSVWNLHVSAPARNVTRNLVGANTYAGATLVNHHVVGGPPQVQAWFDLGASASGGPERIASLDARAVVTPVPVADEALLMRVLDVVAPQPARFAVAKVTMSPGGDEDSPTRLTPTFEAGLPPRAGVPTPGQPSLAAPQWWIQEASSNVQAAHNQCVPAAHANVLQYLENTFGWSPIDPFIVPDNNVYGFGGSNSLTGRLDAWMGRGVVHGGQGSPTGTYQAFLGTSAYLFWSLLSGAQYDLQDLSFRHAGRDVIYFNFLGPPSFRDEPEPTWDWICDRVKDGDGIVLSYGFYNAKGERTGGHQVRIYGCGLVNGVRMLLQLDDPIQTNTDPTNSQGTRWLQRWVSDVDNDGRLNLDGLTSREIEYAMAFHYAPN